MLDVSVAYNRYRFLGYEFLTWVWFLIEKNHDKLKGFDRELVSLDIGNRIVLENRLNDDLVESITIRGDEADLKEGMLALRKGAVATQLNLIYRTGSYEWRFSIKGENFSIGNLKFPETAPLESKDDAEAGVLERIYLYEKAILFVDTMFKNFVQLRISEEWLLKQWIHEV